MEPSLTKPGFKNTFLYAGSLLLERVSYYGVRAILILYMIDVLIIERPAAFDIYAWLTAILFFTRVVGGVLGDLVVGNKWAILLGGAVQAIGCFALCIPSSVTLYVGAGLIVLGSGLHQPNAMAQYGKTLLWNRKYLDAGFTGIYTAINIVVSIGVIVIVYLGDLNYVYGFAVAGIVMLLSAGLAFLATGVEVPNGSFASKSLSKRLLLVFLGVIFVCMFWAIYDFASPGMYSIGYSFESLEGNSLPVDIMTKGVPWISVLFGLILTIGLLFIRIRPLIKFGIGLLLGSFAFLWLLTIPEIPGSGHAVLFIIALLLLSMSEVLVAPTLYTVVTQNVNPKYLATVLAIAFVPIKILGYLFTFLSTQVFNGSGSSTFSTSLYTLELTISVLILGILGLLAIGLGLFQKTLGLSVNLSTNES